MEVVNITDEEESFILTVDDDVMDSLDGSSISSSSLDLSDHSIKNRVEKLHLLFTNQDLDMAKSDIGILKSELEHHRRKLNEVQSQLQDKDDDIAKIKLERDLADAERKLLRQQFAHALQNMEDNLDTTAEFQHVSVHQFTPGFDVGEEWQDHKVTCDIGNRLLAGWKEQEEVHHHVLKDLRVRDNLHSSQNGNTGTKNSKVCSHPRCWGFLIPSVSFRSKVLGSTKGRGRIKLFSIRRKWKHPTLKYQAIHDNDTVMSEEETSINTSPLNSRRDRIENNSETWLIDKILSFGESNRMCMNDVHQHVAMQTRKINGLQREVTRLMSFQMTATSCSFSDDGSAEYGSDIFFSSSISDGLENESDVCVQCIPSSPPSMDTVLAFSIFA